MGTAFVVPSITGEVDTDYTTLKEQEAQRIALRAALGDVIHSEPEMKYGPLRFLPSLP